jgi:hypothetical protein
MSTTLTAPAGADVLRAELRRRALATFDVDDLSDTLFTLQQLLSVDDYWQGPQRPEAMEPDWLGKEWLDQLEAAMNAAAAKAILATVIPAMVDVVVDRLAKAPNDLVRYPQSKQLRADLALLEGKS